MLKRTIAVMVVMMFVFIPLSAAIAAEGPGGNDRKGKYTYRKVYKACMETGEVKSATPTISPSNKTMAQWKEIFEAKNFSEFGCLDNWAALSDSAVLDIYTYFYNHASDSPSPATCQ
jgi:hypothetical protein